MPCNSVRVFRVQLTVNNAKEILGFEAAIQDVVKAIEAKTTMRPVTASQGYYGTVIRVGQYISISINKNGTIEATSSYEAAAARQLLNDIQEDLTTIAGKALQGRLAARLKTRFRGQTTKPFKQGMVTVATKVRV